MASTAVTRLSSRDFNQDTGGAKKAAERGPVIITDRGEPSHVLLTYVEYQELRSKAATNTARPFISVADALSYPESAHIDYEIPKLDYIPHEIDLT